MADEPKARAGGLEGIAMAVAIWVIVLVSSLYFLRYGVPELASDRGYLDTLYYVILGITGAAYILYQLGLGYVIYRYRGDRPGAESSYWHQSHKLELTWTIGTAVILIPIVFIGLIYWDRVRGPAPEDAVTVIAVGAQFQWDFHYPGADGEFGRFDPTLYAIDNQVGLDESDAAAGDDWVLTNQLVLPVDRPARILLRSKDVQHAFFLPNFRVKQDLLPGMNTEVWFTPVKSGSYEVACAELCGLGHYRMRAFLEVMEEAEYQQWLAENAPATEVAAAAPAASDPAPAAQ
jgi:cytochrome c oxidase subunit 2